MKILLTLIILIPSLSWGFDVTIQCEYKAEFNVKKGYEESYDGNFYVQLKELTKINDNGVGDVIAEMGGHLYCSNTRFLGIYTDETFRYDCNKLDSKSLRFIIDRYSGELNEFWIDKSKDEIVLNRFAVCKEAKRKF
jgi:hypothetical protein